MGFKLTSQRLRNCHVQCFKIQPRQSTTKGVSVTWSWGCVVTTTWLLQDCLSITSIPVGVLLTAMRLHGFFFIWPTANRTCKIPRIIEHRCAFGKRYGNQVRAFFGAAERFAGKQCPETFSQVCWTTAIRLKDPFIFEKFEFREVIYPTIALNCMTPMTHAYSNCKKLPPAMTNK